MLTKVLTGQLTFTSLRPLDLSNCTKEEIQAYFNNSYDLNESLFTSLTDDSAFYKCPDRLRLPLIFYYAHTSCVFINKLMLAGLLQKRVNLEFETLFETGVDEMSWDDTENYRMGGSYKWPDLDDVIEYRRQVRNIILNVIEKTPLQLPITIESPWWALFMGMEHERIHLETSSVLIRQLPVDMVTRPDGWVYGPNKHGEGARANRLVRVEGGEVTYGKPASFPSYGWDNEYGQVTANVCTFEASQYMVTNGEFMEFVKTGGYGEKVYWTEEGWQWTQYAHAKHPKFWVCQHDCPSRSGSDLANYSHCRPSYKSGDEHLTNGNQQGSTNGFNNQTSYRYRLMFDEIEMPCDWPVDVNYHEARAFCAWKGPGYRLPTEAEHNLMRGSQAFLKLGKLGDSLMVAGNALHNLMRGSQKSVSEGVSCDIVYGEDLQANLNLKYGSSTPVNLFPPTTVGFYDVSGNIWEWMEDHFNGLDGYHSHWLYDDFSSPCFDGRHNIILGGSWIATGDEASRFARYAFRRHFFQHCGFRLARSVSENGIKTDLSARVIKPDVFIPGEGVADNSLSVDDQMVCPNLVFTSNTQYCYDEEPALWGIIELEFGFRESFANVCAQTAIDLVETYNSGILSAVHLGSGLGRTCFLLGNVFAKVLGIDFGGRFVDTACGLQQDREMSYLSADGEMSTITLEQDINTDHVLFKQLTWIPNEVNQHDLVLVTFLDRTLHPKAWLVRLWEIVWPTGIVVIVSRDDRTEEELAQVFGSRLVYSAGKDVIYEMGSGRHKAHVTVWVKA